MAHRQLRSRRGEDKAGGAGLELLLVPLERSSSCCSCRSCAILSQGAARRREVTDRHRVWQMQLLLLLLLLLVHFSISATAGAGGCCFLCLLGAGSLTGSNIRWLVGGSPEMEDAASLPHTVSRVRGTCMQHILPEPASPRPATQKVCRKVAGMPGWTAGTDRLALTGWQGQVRIPTRMICC